MEEKMKKATVSEGQYRLIQNDGGNIMIQLEC